MNACWFYLRVVFGCRGTGSKFAIISISKGPHHHAVERHDQRVVEATGHLGKFTGWSAGLFQLFLFGLKPTNQPTNSVSHLPHMISLQGGHPLGQHLVGCRPLTQTTWLAAAEGEQLPICSDHGGVPETTSELRRRQVTSKQNKKQADINVIK